MKLVFLVLIFASIGCKVSQNQSSLEIYQDKKYSVEKIDSINSYYLIYLIQDKKKFKIVSKRKSGNLSSCVKKIEVGQEYLLELQKLVPTPIKDSNPLSNKPSLTILSCYYFDENTKICEEVGMEILYKANNLDGLCIAK